MSATWRRWRTRTWSSRSARWFRGRTQSRRTRPCRRTSRSSARWNRLGRTTQAPQATAYFCRAVGPASFDLLQLDLRPDLEHLVRRDLEEGRRPQGVARHERKQRRPPVVHPGPIGADEGLATQEERRPLHPDVEGFHAAGFQDVFQVRVVHKPVAGDHGVESLSDVLHRHALARLDMGNVLRHDGEEQDRKSTRLNSSHSQISYAVFCLKKKNLVTRGLPQQSKKDFEGVIPDFSLALNIKTDDPATSFPRHTTRQHGKDSTPQPADDARV